MFNCNNFYNNLKYLFNIIALVEISCEKMFFIAFRQYASHKFYDLAIMRVLMTLRHYNIKENICKFERKHHKFFERFTL